jgi:hypothetical protein
MFTTARASCLVITLAVVLSSGPARAADPRAEEARRECLAGRYQRGIDLLAALYSDTRDANYIYNQGRCFQQNNRPDEAISRFREYLRAANDLSPDEQADVRRQIVECQQLQVERERPRPPAVVTPATPPPALMVRESGRLPAGEPSSGRGLRIAGGVVMGAGLGALGFGVAMGVRAHGLRKEMEDRFAVTGDYSRNTYDSGHRAWVMSWIGGVAGAALAGSGALLYYLGVRDRTAPSRVAAAPVLAPGALGAGLHVSF